MFHFFSLKQIVRFLVIHYELFMSIFVSGCYRKMPYDNQHSHVFLVDINSIGEYKYKPGVKKVGKYLKETVQLASHSVQTLIKSVGVITCSQVRLQSDISQH